jgi:hypothetical protein
MHRHLHAGKRRLMCSCTWTRKCTLVLCAGWFRPVMWASWLCFVPQGCVWHWMACTMHIAEAFHKGCTSSRRLVQGGAWWGWCVFRCGCCVSST